MVRRRIHCVMIRRGRMIHFDDEKEEDYPLTVRMFRMVVMVIFKRKIIMITMMMVRWWLCWSSTFLLSQAVVRPIPSWGEEFYVSLDFKNLRLVFKFSADFYFFLLPRISRILYFCFVLMAWLCCRTPFPVLFTGMLCPIFPSAVLNVIIELSWWHRILFWM